MKLPTREDINVSGSLDEQRACDHFLSKSLEEAQEMFRRAFDRYQEDLMWMGPAAFRYYVEAAVRYVESDAAKGDSAIPVFFGPMIRFRLEHEPQELVPVARRLAGTCQYILDHWREFDPGPAPDPGDDPDQHEVYKTLKDALLQLR